MIVNVVTNVGRKPLAGTFDRVSIYVNTSLNFLVCVSGVEQELKDVSKLGDKLKLVNFSLQTNDNLTICIYDKHQTPGRTAIYKVLSVEAYDAGPYLLNATYYRYIFQEVRYSSFIDLQETSNLKIQKGTDNE